MYSELEISEALPVLPSTTLVVLPSEEDSLIVAGLSSSLYHKLKAALLISLSNEKHFSIIVIMLVLSMSTPDFTEAMFKTDFFLQNNLTSFLRDGQ